MRHCLSTDETTQVLKTFANIARITNTYLFIYLFILFVLYLKSITVPNKIIQPPTQVIMVNTSGNSKIIHDKMITFSVVNSISKRKHIVH